MSFEQRVQKDVCLAPMTSLGIGGSTRYFAEAQDEGNVQEAFRWAADAGLAVFVLGGGSNLLVPDEVYPGLVLRVAILGVEREGCRFTVGAGESWDALVDVVVTAGCAGMECLAGIPGSVGATPVQNVGAYGQEVAQTIESVRAFDRQTNAFAELSAAECRFRYRQSVFNTEERGRYVITRVRYRLEADGVPTLRYADLQRYFAGRSEAPTLQEVASAVRAIRRSKGMVLEPGDPDTQSAGSFFKNPVVRVEEVPRIAAAAGVEAAAMPGYPAGEGFRKLSAAWLVERAGFSKGYLLGAVGVSTKHSLALTNRGGARYADLRALEERIREGVQAKFGLELEREPVLLR